MSQVIHPQQRNRFAQRASSQHAQASDQPKGIESFRDLPAFALLQHAAEALPDREAVVYGDKQWTFSDINDQSVKCAAMLQQLGIRYGDRVGLLLPNVPEYIIAANGVWRAGGVAIAISPLMVAEEVEALLASTQCRTVVCLDMLSHLVPDEPRYQKLLVSIRDHLPALHQIGYLWARHSRTGSWTLPESERTLWFWENMKRVERNWQPITLRPATDPAYIIPTGGTTAAPKAVTLSHENLVANAWQQYEWTERSFGEEKMVGVLPFFHSYGMSATVMAGTAMGATLLLHHRFNTRQTIRMIAEHRPTVFHAVPAMLDAMNQRLRSHPCDLSSLRWVISGGAPLDEAIGAEFAEHTGALVVEGYGLSEASPVTHVGHLFRSPSYGSIGMALPKTDCRIVDQSNESHAVDVPRGEVGELIVRGPQVMLGYWNNEQATKGAIRDGWLHTGDLAIRRGDHYEIVGRKKDLIITSGFNVYPCEVESVLRDCELVLDAAVVGLPDRRRGELVKAFVVLRPGATWDEEQLHAHCCQHLSKHKRPKLFERCEGDLPRNFLGKVIRRRLREQQPEPTTDMKKEDK